MNNTTNEFVNVKKEETKYARNTVVDRRVFFPNRYFFFKLAFSIALIFNVCRSGLFVCCLRFLPYWNFRKFHSFATVFCWTKSIKTLSITKRHNKIESRTSSNTYVLQKISSIQLSLASIVRKKKKRKKKYRLKFHAWQLNKLVCVLKWNCVFFFIKIWTIRVSSIRKI